MPEQPAYGWTEIPVTVTYRDPAAGATAPKLSLQRQARFFVSPPGIDYVSDLPFSAESNDWGPVERDTSNGESAKGDGARCVSATGPTTRGSARTRPPR
ncbi:hypothetical protein NKH18_31930 [Streptomyces sp. M10(2022)]